MVFHSVSFSIIVNHEFKIPFCCRISETGFMPVLFSYIFTHIMNGEAHRFCHGIVLGILTISILIAGAVINLLPYCKSKKSSSEDAELPIIVSHQSTVAAAEPSLDGSLNQITVVPRSAEQMWSTLATFQYLSFGIFRN